MSIRFHCHICNQLIRELDSVNDLVNINPQEMCTECQGRLTNIYASISELEQKFHAEATALVNKTKAKVEALFKDKAKLRDTVGRTKA